MQRQNVFTFAVGGLVLCAMASVILWPQKLQRGTADAPVDSITLAGIVRDFRAVHPDFAVAPTNGFGHYADDVVRWLDYGAVPRLSTGGYKVEQQWRDRESRPIAPHLAGLMNPFGGGTSNGMTFGARVADKIHLHKESTIDAFSSARGPYGVNRNYGRGAYISTNSVEKDRVKLDSKSIIHGSVMIGPGGNVDTVVKGKGMIGGTIGTLDAPVVMPAIAMPTDLQPYVEHADLEGPVTLTGDINPDDDVDVPAMHFGKLHVKKHASVFVDGDLRIVCDKEFKVDGGTFVLLPDSTLTLYVDGKVEFKHRTLVNTEHPDTTSMIVNVLGDHTVEVEDESHVYATIIAPDSKIKLKDKAHLYGGLMARELDIEDKAGFHVDTSSASVAPWNFAVTVREKIEIKEHTEVDGFDSNLGPYGEGNKGIEALLVTNSVESDKVKIDKATVTADILVGYGGDTSKVIEIKDSTVTGSQGRLAEPMPVPVVTPPLMGFMQDEVEYKDGEFTLSQNLYCKKLKIEKKAVLEIVGDVTIRCDDKLELKDKSEIRLAPNSSLTLYVRKEIKVEDQSRLNMNTGDPKRVSIRRMTLGKGKIEIKKSEVCAWIQGAQTEMKLDESEFFGSFTGKKLEAKKSKVHVDMAFLNPCLDVDDTAGQRGDEGHGGITSADSFGQWFQTVSGVNRAAVHRITLTRASDGAYEYLTDGFHPIDDRLLGNEGALHNRYLTYVLKADFNYSRCSGGFVQFEGGDGTWLFVDGNLCIDLGGVRTNTTQLIEIDRLGLSDGTHRLELYYAQRDGASAEFKLRTNLELNTDRIIPSGSYD